MALQRNRGSLTLIMVVLFVCFLIITSFSTIQLPFNYAFHWILNSESVLDSVGTNQEMHVIDNDTIPVTWNYYFGNKVLIFVGDSIMRWLSVSLIETLTNNTNFCDNPAAMSRPNCVGTNKYFDLKRCAKFRKIQNMNCFDNDTHTQIILNDNKTTIIYLSCWDFIYFFRDITVSLERIYKTFNNTYEIIIFTGFLLHSLKQPQSQQQQFEYKYNIINWYNNIKNYSNRQIWISTHFRSMNLIPIQYQWQSNELISRYNKIAKNISLILQIFRKTIQLWMEHIYHIK